MSKVEAIKGTLSVFWKMTKEDWEQMDHKFFKIIFGAIGFIVMALFWLYFLKTITPF